MGSKSRFVEEALVNDYQIMERTLVKEWHIDAKVLADARRGYLRKDVHWQWRDTRVYYSPSGVEELKKYVTPKLDREVKKEKETLAQAEYKRSVPNTYPLSETIVAVDRIWPNPRLLRCVNAYGKQIAVRVRGNAHFRKGMRINLATQCRRMGQGATSFETYELLDRGPRLPGRW